jgi:hypothetical protein
VPFPDRPGDYFVRFEIGQRDTPLALADSKPFKVDDRSVNINLSPAPPFKICRFNAHDFKGGRVLFGTEHGLNFLCGSPGDDQIRAPSPDGNRIDAGSGDDVIKAANGGPDEIWGGPGRDSAVIDPYDLVYDVESVVRRQNRLRAR